MTRVRLGPVAAIRSRLRVPGDKSISHRALILNAMAGGTAVVTGLAPGRDVASTTAALAMLGVPIAWEGRDRLHVSEGAPWRAAGPIDCGNSGTTTRLLLGVLAARAAGPVTLTGDGSLSRRPMGRVVEPLTRMGAVIEGSTDAAGGAADRLPLTITGRPLRAARHRLPVSSAQVKSALLLAGLAAEGETVVEEPGTSRDHTERMLAAMGARIEAATPSASGGTRTVIHPGPLAALAVDVPGDLSSAAPFLALAAAQGGGEIVIGDVGLNPTRTGFLDLLTAFGAEVEATIVENGPEPRGTLRVVGRGLTAIEIGPEVVPRAIDELPLVAVLATQAEGDTVVRGAAELRVKESDRIAAIVTGLRRMGAEIDALPDGFAVRGPTPLAGAELDVAGDHRIGMAFAVATALARGESALEGAEWVAVSYPTFFEDLAAVCP